MRSKNTGIRKIAEERKDVFVHLTTGFGKSLLYQGPPLVFDLTSLEPGHIVVIVSLLISLMGDQVCHLRELGLKAANMSSLSLRMVNALVLKAAKIP